MYIQRCVNYDSAMHMLVYNRMYIKFAMVYDIYGLNYK